MIVDELLKRPGSWLSMREDTGVVISSRIRLARNIQDMCFPDWAEDADCVALSGRLLEALKDLPQLRSSLYLDMGDLSPVDKEVLRERHLISFELAEKGRGSGVVVSGDEQAAVMINEEDHLRMQVICPGMELPALWEKINALDTELESRVPYSFRPDLGYLTACPSNVGTGLRASVMMHLSGLKFTDEVDGVIKGLDRLGLAVRGLEGEGTEASGNMFQVSNQVTLGESEAHTIQRLTEIVREVVSHEMNARERLMESRQRQLLDHIGRCIGVLTHAVLLSSRESIDLLSGVRLGVELGVVRNLAVSRINETMLMTQPGHLQKIAGAGMDPEDRDGVRARMVRESLAGIQLVGGRGARSPRTRRQQSKKGV